MEKQLTYLIRLWRVILKIYFNFAELMEPCKLKIIRIAGYSKKELSKHPKEGMIKLKKLSNSIFYFPVEVRIPLTIGSFYVNLTQNLVLQ